MKGNSISVSGPSLTPPASCVDCDPIIQTATTIEFLLSNRRKPQNFIFGELVSGGQLSFIVENLPKDGKGCFGWWMFDTMMRHFGTSVTCIQGNWTYGDNLATINLMTVNGIMSIEAAAKNTPTGRYATSWGFRQVQLTPSIIGSPGLYTRVHVLFTP